MVTLIQRLQVQLLLPRFQNYDVVLAMVCAKPRANTINIAPCFHKFMAIVNVEWWYVPHRFQLDKAKQIMNLLLLCFQLEKQKMLQTIGFVTFLMVCTVISRT